MQCTIACFSILQRAVHRLFTPLTKAQLTTCASKAKWCWLNNEPFNPPTNSQARQKCNAATNTAFT